MGYIPPADLAHELRYEVLLPSTNRLGSAYSLSPYYSYGIQYYLINFHNPKTGPIFSQLYVRQALQEVMDQNGMINAIDNGYGYPTSGAVPDPAEEPVDPADPERERRPGPVRVLHLVRHLAAHQPRLGRGGRRDDLPEARLRR